MATRKKKAAAKPDVRPGEAFITCACGKTFQNVPGADLGHAFLAYTDHQPVCPANAPTEG